MTSHSDVTRRCFSALRGVDALFRLHRQTSAASVAAAPRAEQISNRSGKITDSQASLPARLSSASGLPVTLEATREDHSWNT